MVYRKSSRSNRRSRSKRRSRVAPRSCKSDVEALLLFNKIDWDISRDIDDAVLNGITARLNPEWLETEWCNGGMKLLLPVSKRDTQGKSLIVYYRQNIPRKIVRFGDVLYTIWEFYNMEHVLHEDLTYVSVSDTMKGFAKTQLSNYLSNPSMLRNMRFVHFLSPQTKFVGLTRQHENIYSLTLATPSINR